MNFPSPFYRWRPHPWHGLEAGRQLPHIVHAYIEITPFDNVKYEIDKLTVLWGVVKGVLPAGGIRAVPGAFRLKGTKRVKSKNCPANIF